MIRRPEQGRVLRLVLLIFSVAVGVGVMRFPDEAAADASLVAAYGFNEGSGTSVADASGNGNTGTITGATWTPAGRFGGALNFDGVSSIVRVASAASLNLTTGMTLEAWIYPTAAQSSWRTILQREGPSASWAPYFLNASNDSGPLRPSGGGQWGSTGAYISGTTASPVSAWTHVALTWDAATLRLYVNGVLATSAARTGTLAATTNPLWIGGNSPYGEYFQGIIDELRIYNRALAQAEIQTDMTTAVIPPGPDTTVPTTPASLTATAVSGSQINLSWPAATDNVGVTGYLVERCQGTGCTTFGQVLTPTGTSVSDTGLTVGTSYSYRVRATDGAGNLSGYSPTATATTPAPDAIPPTAPASLTATPASATQINLSWTAATDNVGVTGYRVERCQGTGCTTFAQVLTPTGTSVNDTGLTAGTSYSYRVRAADAAGNLSTYSPVASATTLAAPASLVAAYGFNEGSGTSVADASGNGNTGTITGATWTPAGRFGGALNFDGVSSIVRVASAASLNLTTGMTLEAWIYPTAAQSSWRTILQREGPSASWAPYFLNASNDSGPLRPSGGGQWGSTGAYISGTTASPVSAWTHVALTWDAATLRLYVNGVLATSAARTGTLAATTNPLWIGGNSPYGEYFQGIIDELRIYNRALAQAEIQTDMTTAVIPPGPDTTVPTTPASLTATAVSGSQINLSWPAATDNVGVTGYLVERCQGTGCTTFGQVLTPTGTSVSDTGLTVGTSYSYRVRATDGAGNLSGYSPTATATTPAPDAIPPTAPASLTATPASATQINLSWTAATDNVGVTGYRVERCQGTGCTTFAQVLTPTGTSVNDTGLTAGTSYSYRVRAADAAGNLSTYSPVASATTLDTTPPTAPTGLTATAAGTSQINLAWTAATDNVGVTGYRVERCQGTGCTTFAQVLSPTATSVNDTGLSASTSYSYRVRAVDGAGNLGGYSNTASATTTAAPDTTVPTTPASLTATAVSGSQINLSWPAATDNVGVTGYLVERCQGTGCTTFGQVLTPTGTSVSDTGLTVGTSYSYRVRATDGAGNLSGYSPTATATTPAPDAIPPTAPASLTATPASATQINLSWTAATDNVGVTGYRVERCQGTGCTTFAQVLTPTGTSVNDTGLTAGTSYSYRVRAADAAGNLSTYSPVASATTLAAPASLVAAYGFNEGSGTSVADASGNGNTGTITGATWTSAGRFGGALNFDGVSSIVRVASAASLNLTTGMTLEAWIYPTAAQSSWRTILQREGPSASWAPYFLNASNDSGPLRPSGGGQWGSTGAYISGTTASPVSAWTHVALTWDAATLRLYVNGVLATSAARTGTLAATTNPLWIGGNSPYGEYFQGIIDELRIYNRALAQAEIQTDMTTGIAPDTAAPTAPAGLSASAPNSSQINLSWTASTDNVVVAGYQVERCQGTGCTSFAQVLTATGTNVSDIGLPPLTSYSYRVRAVDGSGNLSGYSNTATATTQAPDTTPPTAPPSLTATPAGATQISLGWTSSTDNIGVTGYRVERCQGVGCSIFTQILTTTGTSVSDTGLTALTSYSYRVRATDVAGNLSGYSSTASATTLSGGNPIVIENQLPGTSAWQLGNLYGRPYATDDAGQIKGYASAVSVNKGEIIRFHVSVSPAQTYTIDVYRMGWYGGLGGRLMQHIGPLNGATQPACPANASTGMMECNWAPAYDLATQLSWTSGIYLAVLKNANGFHNYMIFTLRDDSRVAALLYQQAVTTYQAYNSWGGKSLYEHNSSGANTLAGTVRAVKVSFDRPYADDGAGTFLWLSEFNFIRWAEKSGYDINYSTDVDTHRDGSHLLNYRGFLSVPHDEYWSKPMYDAVTSARNAGVNLAFLGANSIFWQARFEPSSNGAADRVLVCYRDAALDPNTDPTLKTVQWRNSPVNRPEQALLGVQFTDGPNNGTASYVVANSGNWVWAGTGFTDGAVVPGLVWYEADRQVADDLPVAVPGTYTLLSNSPYQGSTGAEHNNSSIYQALSGAWVFATGTMGWSWGLDNFYPEGSQNAVDVRIQRATANVLDRFGGR